LTPLSLIETQQLLASIPFDQMLGIRLVRLHSGGLTLACEMRPELANAVGALHGGVTASLVDVAAGVAVTRHIGRPRSVTTVELKVNYLRPVREGKVLARAHLVRVGKTLCTARVDVVDSRKELIAVGLVTYMIVQSGTAPAA
jgi:uncharacterized protein (TIGR00369 family)